ncbi:hypothetical protein PLESTB_000260700 [Pleodorina starrii]|uniref:Uncharacterized protein n=1 Tax=Pleodorina starrii TaxID=330485 RepID=A0A9W6BD56_9CHLO|nr:hypothetical protein PLESTM_000690300 [Pleodorina starrii]GLC49580.1 hypothetical protein PLESTB_000260700 [Pleodorina starrii]GLC65630.1 hypothetical protein PLESTF_000320800 [Pleodorina starrii]
MEEYWDNNGPYALAKLADRLVPIPRDNEAQVSLYALCRAWVRNNPALPLVAEAPSPQQSYSRDAAARAGGAAGTSLNGEALQAGAAQQSQAAAAPLQAQQPQPQLDSQAPAAQQPLQASLPHDPQADGLLSILPPVLPPTALETSTAPPTYPLDDAEAAEPEEAMRKFKDHWVAVRQYHQALRSAKLSRHRERLLLLLGEPSLLQPQAGPMGSMQQQPLPMSMPMQMAMQMQMAGIAAPPGLVMGGGLGQLAALGPDQLAAAAAANGVGMPGLMFPGPAGQGLGLAPGVAGFAVSQAGDAGGAPVAVSSADAQAALATIMGLGPAVLPTDSSVRQQLGEGGDGIPGAAQLLQLGQQQQQLFLQLQHQQQLGLLAGEPAVGAAGQMTMLPPMEALQALQQQHQQSVAAASAQQPVLGKLSAAVAEAAEGAQGPQGNGNGPQSADMAGAASNVATSASEVREQVEAAAPLQPVKEEPTPVQVQGLDGMDIDSGPPPGS